MRHTRKKLTCLYMMFAAGLSWQGIAPAEETGLINLNSGSLADDRQHPEHEWLPVSGAYLDDMRGGFDTDSGMKISFGIRREVYMNDNLVASTNLNIADINGGKSEQVQTISPVHMLHLIQNGSGNHFDAGAISQSATSIVIQNTLSQQDIRSLTIIDAKANSLDMLKSLNMQSALTEAISQSVGTR